MNDDAVSRLKPDRNGTCGGEFVAVMLAAILHVTANLRKLDNHKSAVHRPRLDHFDRQRRFLGKSALVKTRRKPIILDMKSWDVVILTVILEILAVGAVAAPMAAQELPMPRSVPSPGVQELPLPRLMPVEDGAPFSAADFQRLLAKMKDEREALDAEWKSMTRRLSTPPPRDEPDLEKLQKKMQDWIKRLEDERRAKAREKSAAHPTIAVPEKPPTPMPVIAEKKKTEQPHVVPPEPLPQDGIGPVDVLHMAQTLFRVERYEEALEAFRKIDLKGKRPEERVPIVYMTAKCLFYAGKTDEAIAMLRSAANAPSDERVAGYAQWQIEVLRWYRDVDTRLEDIRQRRMATEKR